MPLPERDTDTQFQRRADNTECKHDDTEQDADVAERSAFESPDAVSLNVNGGQSTATLCY
jgi:hypothetical protein